MNSFALLDWAGRNPEAAEAIISGTAAVIPLSHPTIGWPAFAVAYASPKEEGAEQCLIRELEYTRLDRKYPTL